MFKVLLKLKKSWKSVLIVVTLLIVQAMAELALPDYTSNIVNVGIQQGGIENCVPQVVRKASLESMLLATDEDDFVLDKYELISRDSLSEKDYKKYLKKYPKLENEDLYVLKKISDEDEERLENILAKPLIMLYFIETQGQADMMKQYVISMIGPSASEARYLQSLSLIEIVEQLPKEKADELISLFGDEIDKKVGSMLGQSAVTATKYEYQMVGMNMDKLQTDYIWMSGFRMLGVALIIMITGVTIMFFSSGMACRLAKHLREEVFEKVLKFSNKEFREFSTASLITRSTNDIQQIQGMIQMLFRTVIFAPIMGIGGLIRVIAKSNTSMIWIIGFAILCILAIVLVLFIVAMPKFKKLQVLIDKINLVAREILTGLPVIRAFHKERDEEKRFDKANVDLMNVNVFVNRVMSFMMPLMMLLMNGIMLLIIWVRRS